MSCACTTFARWPKWRAWPTPSSPPVEPCAGAAAHGINAFAREEVAGEDVLLAFIAFGWVALADILVVAAVLYAFLTLIKDTRAFPMLLAAVLLLGLYYGTSWARLETMRWVLANLLPYFVFALIVIYAGEIRRALGRLGRLPLVASAFGNPDRGDPYDDIVLAASHFAQHRIGALIVIERDIDLNTYIESGIGLDGLLTYDLLVSVFHPGSPLHDGAVIVRKNRVAAAACFLPLSLNPLLSTQLGTPPPPPPPAGPAGA